MDGIETGGLGERGRCDHARLGGTEDPADALLGHPRRGLAGEDAARGCEAATKVAEEGVRWVLGASEPGMVAPASLSQAAGLDAIQRAQSGLIADMDDVARAIYARVDA